MFTVDEARGIIQDDLDERIECSVKNSCLSNGVYLRVYIEDHFCHNIKEELEKRGFRNIDAPYIVLKGDVYLNGNFLGG